MGLITKLCVEKILDTVRIEDIIKDYVELKQQGPNYKGKSPFVEEKTASFVVSPVKQIYKDFSSGKGGSVVNFLMEKVPCSYPEALGIIAQKYSIDLEYENAEAAAKMKVEIDKKDKLRETLTSVYNLYRDEFTKSPEHHPARIEVEDKRGYTKDEILEWGIGYAPQNFLYDKLKNSGKVNEGLDLGLIKKGNYENKYDAYSERVIYPIHDDNGLLVGLAGRSLKDNPRSKWINPTVDQSNLLYQKSKILFGYHKAKNTIRKRNEVYLVEGYNDVIAWHKYGCENTVAVSGTAISPAQLTKLKRICDKLVFCMDPDKAGDAAVLKFIPDCLAMGFRVDVVNLPCDPDDFSRINFLREYLERDKLDDILKSEGARVDGFKLLLQSELNGDAIDNAKGAERLSKILATIKDKPIRIIYEEWLAKESGVTKRQVQTWIKEVETKKQEEEQEQATAEWDYELPKGCTKTIKDLLPDIRNYGMFQDNAHIYVIGEKDYRGKHIFSSVSNFEIFVMMHIKDEAFPKKLIRVKNEFGETVVFDTNQENINSLQVFYNTLTAQGNFRFDGNNNVLKLLNRYLMDKMGSGKKIDVLGKQVDAPFWVWNNAVLDDEGNTVEMNEHGVIEFQGVHYYVPSANKNYATSKAKFKSQKQFKVMPNDIPFDVYLAKVKRVHREHSISAILFAIASLFLDVVEEELKCFPILFLYGPGSSGKDELAYIVQSFTGIPQEAINLESDASTVKGQIREFAQFRNGISQLSEFKRGFPKIEGLIKGLWDRRGYKKGTIESNISTDSVEIESAVILTGNEYPQQEATITRLLANEMVLNEFTQEQIKDFDELKDMTRKGVSGYGHEIIKKRGLFKKMFSEEQRKWKSNLNHEMPGAIGRMVLNYSILATVYTVFKDTINFPFTQIEMIDYFKHCVSQQQRKINSNSITNRFWDIFVASLRGTKDDRLQVGQVVSVEGSQLFVVWRHVYAKINRSWLIGYQEAAPSSNNMLEALEKSGVVLGKKSNHTFTPGKNGIRTSAIIFNMDELEENLRMDIVGGLMFQQSQQEREFGQGNFFDSPATPPNESDLEEVSELPI